MYGIIVVSIILLLTFILVFWVSKYRFKKETGDSYQLAIVALMFILISFASLLLFFDYQLSKEEINAFTITSIVLALGALAITLLLEMENKRIFSILNSNIDTLKEESCEINQKTTQQIVTQIQQLEDLQKALANQIQSLKDSIPTAEPSDEPHEDEYPTGSSTDKGD
jgi:hypothetical protein